MSDIVAELRERALQAEQDGEPISLLDEAADEIERLRHRVRFSDAVIRSGNVAALTDAEREAVEWAENMAAWAHNSDHVHAATLRGLLERTK